MTAPAITFKDLLDPIGVDEFFETYYDRKPLHVPGSPEKVAEICSWDDFNDLLHRTSIWSDRSFNLVLDGKRIPAAEFCEPAASRDGARIMQPASERVVPYLDRGASIVLDLIETLTPGLRAASEAIQMATGFRVSCNAYCSQSEHQAFPSHFDSMDVFAIHIEGRKTWRVYEGRFDGPMERPGFNHTSFPPDYHDKAKGALAMEVELNPGDLLYLPKGVYHDALASTENCLHLSYGTTQPTGLDFMRWVVDGLDEAPLFRKPMPPHDAAADHDARIAALRDSLVQLLQQPDIGSQFREDQRRKAFSVLSSVAVPKPLSRYRVRGRGVRVVRRGSDWRVTTPQGSANLPGDGSGMVDWMLERDHFARDDLAKAFPEAGEQVIIEISQSLISVGFLEPL